MYIKTMILGRAGQDAEMRATPGGKAVAQFSLATSKKWKDQSGQNVEKTQWHTITAWEKQAEFAGKWIQKGGLYLVECEPYEEKYTDKGGVERTVIKYKFLNCTIVSLPKSDIQGQPQGQSKQQPQTQYGDKSEDVPF